MRAKHCLPLAVILSMTWAASAFAQSNIPWISNLHQAQQIAQSEGRLILIHFYTNWCGPCRKLEHDVFPRTDVASAIIKNYVPVLIDAERYRDVAAHYQVERFPTDVITDARGRVVFRTGTPQDPHRYIELLNGVAGDHRFATPGYAMGSDSTHEDPSRYPDRSFPPSQPQNQNWQDRFPASDASVGLRPQGNDYGSSRGSYGQPDRTSYDTRHGYDDRGVPNQYARDSEYGPRYAGQGPNMAQEPARTYTPPMGRETYNPHISPRNGLSQNDTRSSGSSYERRDGPTGTSDYRRPYVSPAPDRTDGWQREPSQHGGRGSYVENPSVGQRYANPGPLTSDSRDQFASTPVAPQLKKSPALEGFCPVTLANSITWKQGDVRWGAEHRGKTYLFASPECQREFLADPDRYSPMLSGYDPVRYVERGELVPGLRQHGMWFNGKMYLFSDEPSLSRLWESRDYFAQKTHDIMMSAGR